MRKSMIISLSAAAAVIAAVVILYRNIYLVNNRINGDLTGIEIEYPRDSTIFPPEIVSPTFIWKDTRYNTDSWQIVMKFEDYKKDMQFTVTKKRWKPERGEWEAIKRRSRERQAYIIIRGFAASQPDRFLSEGEVSFSTSRDEVGAPIFYREVNLPFEDAVVDPTRIRWRFGIVSSEQQPPIVLQKLPVCGNCHSFSADGKTLGLEVDSGNDKGAYAVTKITQEVVLDRTKIISWADYKREDGDPTFGLLCQVAPDGKHVVGTVKDQALAVYRPNLMFSQIFFLIKGTMAIYDRQKRSFSALPGADDPQYVQTNATWSPDGRDIVFAKNKAYDLDSFKKQRRALVGGPEAEDFLLNQGKSYKYDLYRIPFNDGKGGKAEPIEGASHNGKSNYFAKYSPDGKWIVFCKAENYMLLQPDSKLYIMPAKGGEARRMRCNTKILNSWHSWSPNSRWLVFSSKANGPYTQLWLTHIDENGNSSPPVVLEQFTSSDRAANIPEFVNNSHEAIKRINEKYLDAYSYYRIANNFHKCGDFDRAIPAYRDAIKYNPNNYHAYNNLGVLLMGKGKGVEAKQNFIAANNLKIDDEDHYQAHTNLAVCLMYENKFKDAVKELETAYKLYPNDTTKANLERGREKLKLFETQPSLQY